MVGRVSQEKRLVNGGVLTPAEIKRLDRSSDKPYSSLGNTSHERKYLLTLSDLVDRLTIIQQKMIFIPERAEEYRQERELVLHDIDIVLNEGNPLTAKAILAVCLLALTNRFIWENESHVRSGNGHVSDQETLNRLKLTHSINGVRNSAKNMLTGEVGGRHDYKIDCLASDLPPEFGNWKIFD
jgi:hypothetical protein